jgi:hypothetical protein
MCQESYPLDLRRWDHCGINGSNFHQPGQCAQSSKGNIIELLPRTPPISKRPYKMPMNELVELKKQIAEL